MNTPHLFAYVVVYYHTLSIRKSANKQQSQFQMIQRTVTCRNATHINGNINTLEWQWLVLSTSMP